MKPTLISTLQLHLFDVLTGSVNIEIFVNEHLQMPLAENQIAEIADTIKLAIIDFNHKPADPEGLSKEQDEDIETLIKQCCVDIANVVYHSNIDPS